SQPVGSLWFGFPVCEKLRHFPQVRLPSGSLRPAIFKFWLAGGRFYGGCLYPPFSDFRIGAPETGFETCQRTVRKTTPQRRDAAGAFLLGNLGASWSLPRQIVKIDPALPSRQGGPETI